MGAVYPSGDAGDRKWRRDIRTLRQRGLIETDLPPNRTGIVEYRGVRLWHTQTDQRRWPILAPFTSEPDAKVAGSAPGRLFDTGVRLAGSGIRSPAADRVPGVVAGLHPASTDDALAVLDDVERWAPN